MDPSLPYWWILDKTAALNYGYPQLGGARLTQADFVRLRLRLPCGFTKPSLLQITDPNTGDLRFHSAWDKSFATPFGGNHVDIPFILRQENPPNGIWDLFGELDIPIDATNPLDYPKYLARLVNVWVDFSSFPGLEKTQVVMWQARSGGISFPGIERNDLPEHPSGH